MAVFRLLARRAPEVVAAGELAEALSLKASTLSVYVSILTRAGLIRQERVGRSIRYGIELGHLGALIDYLVNDCGRGRPELVGVVASDDTFIEPHGDGRVFNVLFLCTGNSARSIFAEAILGSIGAGRFRAFSAGTRPYPMVNPIALDVLQANGHEVSGLRSKDLDEFMGPESPAMDFVFTVCDHAANEECPPLAGRPVTAHWGMPDPVKAQDGVAAERTLAFQQAYGMMRRRLEAFIELPIESLNRLSLQRCLDAIGSMTPG